MDHILALDQGTTSSRAILFDRQGTAISTAQQEFEQLFPRPGWVEHRPEDIWRSQVDVAKETVDKAGVSPGAIAAIGISNQRETTLVWDRNTGEPIYNAIVWQDRRTAPLCDALRASGLEGLFHERTGLVLDPYFSGTKVRWVLDNVPSARRQAEAGKLAFGTVDTWLAWNLSGGAKHVTDASNASRTLLFNIHQGSWDDELLEALEVPRAILPEVCASSEVIGETAPGLFSAPIPLAGIAGDQQAALFGQLCIEPGMVKTTYGTGCFLLMNTGTEALDSKTGLLTTVAWKTDEGITYALEGSVFVGGAAVQWLRDGLGLIRSAADIERLAAMVEDNGGVYFVPAFTGLGAPHWDPYARGTMVGITRGTTAGHLARATLEGIAHQVADVLDAMASDSGLALAELRTDGGAAANDLLMQFQADVAGVPLVRPEVLETTALGAAYLAGLAVGFWRDLDEIAGQWQVDRCFPTDMPAEKRAGLRDRWRMALERAQGWDAPTVPGER